MNCVMCSPPFWPAKRQAASLPHRSVAISKTGLPKALDLPSRNRARDGPASLGLFFSPRLNDHRVGLVQQWPPVEGARNFKALEAGQTQEQFHFELVNPARRGLGGVRGRDIARVV